jgi:predicted metal-dependent peptidase
MSNTVNNSMSNPMSERDLKSEAARDMVTNGTVLLLQKQPFYASLVLQTEIIECWTIETADIDGKTLRYSPKFVLEQSVKQMAGLLAHEVMHVAQQHHLRRGKREPVRWNVACDYAINPIILDAGMELPEGKLLDLKYEDMSAEEIYELLPKSTSKTCPCGLGDVRDAPGGQEKQDENLAEVRVKVVQAMVDAQIRGDIPDSIQRLIDQILSEKVDWREALARFVSELARNDYNFLKPSVRYLWQGLYLPKLESLETGNIIVIVDTSGSIDEDMINQFAAEITAIAGVFNIGITVIYVDAALQSIQTFEPGEEIILKPKGGGGTSFKPGYEYINKNDLRPRAVVYLTDGCCSDYPAEPDYPTLWIQYGSYHFVPPFGEKIQVAA